MDNPFGQSNQGGYRPPSMSMQQPQGFGGFGGGGGYGGYGGGQQGFGGGGGYGGYGGGQQGFGGNFGGFGGGFGGFGGGFGGFGGFNPMYGGIGGLGFNPMMGPQFMQPMGYGGFGGGYGGYPMTGGFGGGYGGYPMRGSFNPMYGGIGGLGYNPMMGPQFMQPMNTQQPQSQSQLQSQFQPQSQSQLQSQFQPQSQSQQDMKPEAPQLSPYQTPDNVALQNQYGFGEPYFMQPSMDMRYRGGPQMSPEMQQQRSFDMRAAADQVQNAMNLARSQGNASGDYTGFNSFIDPNRVAQNLGQTSGYQMAPTASMNVPNQVSMDNSFYQPLSV